MDETERLVTGVVVAGVLVLMGLVIVAVSLFNVADAIKSLSHNRRSDDGV